MKNICSPQKLATRQPPPRCAGSRFNRIIHMILKTGPDQQVQPDSESPSVRLANKIRSKTKRERAGRNKRVNWVGLGSIFFFQLISSPLLFCWRLIFNNSVPAAATRGHPASLLLNWNDYSMNLCYKLVA